MSDQLTLLPTTAPQLLRESLPLDAIDGFEDAVPSAKLRELVRDLGLLQPVVAVQARAGRYRVVEGRRRCKAIAQLAEGGKWPAPARIDAIVVAGRQAGRHEVRGGLTLALHASRTASPADRVHQPAEPFKAMPVRRAYILKPESRKRRPLGIPTVTSYREVAQRAFGFVGGHASVSSAVR